MYLHFFCTGNALAADILLRLGCNPNIQDHDGNTPVHFACIHGHGHVVEVLTGNTVFPVVMAPGAKTNF